MSESLERQIGLPAAKGCRPQPPTAGGPDRVSLKPGRFPERLGRHSAAQGMLHNHWAYLRWVRFLRMLPRGFRRNRAA